MSELRLATFNLHNLGVDIVPERLARTAAQIVGDLQIPDILAVQEVKASDPPDSAGGLPATGSFRMLIDAVTCAGGPEYAFCEIPPLPSRDGGQAGFNIRVGLLYNPRRIALERRGDAGPEDATGIRWRQNRAELTLNPGRIEPCNSAFAGDPKRHWAPSRKTLAAEFCFAEKRVFVIACHLKSMRASSRREAAYTKKQRHAQADIIHRFASYILGCDPQARVVIIGDMNDLPGSKTLDLLTGNLFINLVEAIPARVRYTRRHSRQAQTLDHILVSKALAPAQVHIPHVNSDCTDLLRASDHDPVLAVVNAA